MTWGRFGRVKGSEGGSRSSLHRLDGVALVKGVRVPAPHVGSLERPQHSSSILLLDAKRANCAWACEKWDNKSCW